MTTMTIATMLKMRDLHSVLAEHGVMCLMEASDLSGLRKDSCKKWMQNLVDMGHVTYAKAPEGDNKRVGTLYYTVTDKPYPALDLPSYGDDRKPSGVHELSRRVVKAVNMGMHRDYLVAAFFGEKA